MAKNWKNIKHKKDISTKIELQFIALVVVCYIVVLSIYLLLIAAAS